MIRRTSKESAITFREKQIEDVIQFASYLEKLGNEVKIVCIAHFPYGGWFRMNLNEFGYISGNIQVNQQGEWIAQ